MTEAEWLECKDPVGMLEFVRRGASERKLRLFAVACCRRLEVWLPDQRSWDSVQVAELFADGIGSPADLLLARRDAEASFREDRAAFGAVAATSLAAWDAAQGAVEAVDYLGWDVHEEGEEREIGQASLARDIFNPFRRVRISPFWLLFQEGAVPKLVRTIYDDRAFDRLPLLADALDDGGCTNADILSHCRSPGPHMRGCWVIDLLLDRE
jgi:hypothetical protein